MHEIVLFGEDFAHYEIIDALVGRVAEECEVDIRPDWRSAVRGHGRVVAELTAYLRELTDQGGPRPDLIVAATDANCKGMNERRREIERPEAPAPMVLAIPDPHIERWLLLDGAAFRAVFGRGCDAPDRKCSRDRYKYLLAEAVHAAGIAPDLGGIEFARDIVSHMDIDRAARLDPSFSRFVDDLRTALRGFPRHAG